jgi:predicted nuclease of predicted toxin-antitoxin system
MRVLLDECVDPGVRGFLPDHEVATVGGLGWSALADSDILTLAQGNFDVFITLDRGFEFQHNLVQLSFGIVIAHPMRNRVEDYKSIAEALREAVKVVRRGEVFHVRVSPANRM